MVACRTFIFFLVDSVSGNIREGELKGMGHYLVLFRKINNSDFGQASGIISFKYDNFLIIRKITPIT